MGFSRLKQKIPEAQPRDFKILLKESERRSSAFSSRASKQQRLKGSGSSALAEAASSTDLTAIREAKPTSRTEAFLWQHSFSTSLRLTFAVGACQRSSSSFTLPPLSEPASKARFSVRALNRSMAAKSDARNDDGSASFLPAMS